VRKIPYLIGADPDQTLLKIPKADAETSFSAGEQEISEAMHV
jgi:hypothetical protein